MLKTHNYSEKRLIFFLRMDKIQTFSIAKAIPCPPNALLNLKYRQFYLIHVRLLLSRLLQLFNRKSQAIAPPFGLTFSDLSAIF